MAKRVRVPRQHEALVRSLGGATKETAKESAFESMAEALAFAAVFGFEQSRRIRFTDAAEGIDLIKVEYIPGNIIDVLALMETKQLDVFAEHSEDTRLEIFEEYACGGLTAISELLIGKNLGSMRIDTLIRAIKRNSTELESI